MKVRLISDVHLDNNRNWIPPKNWEDSDLGILAGDIGNPYDPQYKNVLIHTARKHRISVLVPGNHEYYNEDKSMESIKEKLKELTRDTGVILLDNTTYDISSPVSLRLIGSTLFPYIPNEYYPYLKRIKHGLVTKISRNMYPLSIDELNQLNKNDKHFLQRMITQGEDSIVITHYPPTSMMLDDSTEHLPDVITHWSECMDMITENIKLWTCGHCHTAKRFMVRGKIPLIANCVRGGYFDEGFEILIK